MLAFSWQFVEWIPTKNVPWFGEQKGVWGHTTATLAIVCPLLLSQVKAVLTS